jgi:hypothetical protein
MAFWHRDRRVLWKGIGSAWWGIPSTHRIYSTNQSDSPLLANFSFGLLTSETKFQYLFHSVLQQFRRNCVLQHNLASHGSPLLAQGITATSLPPCSAPIILQKQQDTWNLCVAYSVLDAQTVKDTFPPPVVEELLDVFVMPFDLSPTPQTFQHLMTPMLQHCHSHSHGDKLAPRLG